jgi:hypothetical protein
MQRGRPKRVSASLETENAQPKAHPSNYRTITPVLAIFPAFDWRAIIGHCFTGAVADD